MSKLYQIDYFIERITRFVDYEPDTGCALREMFSPGSANKTSRKAETANVVADDVEEAIGKLREGVEEREERTLKQTLKEMGAWHTGDGRRELPDPIEVYTRITIASAVLVLRVDYE